MKRIVIATDGSPDAAVAVAQGLELAAALQGRVTFVYARTTVADDISRSRAVIADAMGRATIARVDADYEIRDGSPGEAVVTVADSHDADLIVVGSRGLGAVQGVLFGSVSRWLVTHCDRPVLVVKVPKAADVTASDAARSPVG